MTEDAPTSQTVLLPVGAELYALPIEWVREVLAAPTVTWLATAPPSVLGLINLRGEIVPLIDTAAVLGVGGVGGTSIKYAVVAHTPHGPAALAVSGFPQRAELGAQMTPSELAGTAGIYQLDRRAVVLLDPTTLLTPERLGGHEVHPHGLPIGVG